MSSSQRVRMAMIGSYVPRRCGIATFSHNLATAISEVSHTALGDARSEIRIVAMNDQSDTYSYDAEVIAEIHQQHRNDYRNAADIINTSRIDAVCLQHEYGLFGGDCGEHLFDLLDRLRKPLISTLHSVLSKPSPKQREVMERICAISSRVVVMVERAKMLLMEVYGVPKERIRIIPHGGPDVPFGDTEPFKKRFGVSNRPMILTFGLLGPGKSLETVIEALATVVPDHPDLAYIILGVTHPGVRREHGELYRLSLERRVVELGIQNNVLFHNHYVSDDDLCEYLQAADIYVTPYRDKEQITSGTLAYAMTCGKAVISTPYWHAQELLVNGCGRLVEFGNVQGFSDAIGELIADRGKRLSMQRAAYNRGRSMVWPNVGRQYVDTLNEAIASHAEQSAERTATPGAMMRMSLPELYPDYLETMTDDTGILQHAVYSTPNRHHGYCSDDNARALIVASMGWSLFQDDRWLPYMDRYLGFLHYAYVPETNRFRNVMSYDRKWMDNDESDDCQGRVVWALGYLISHAPSDSVRQLATDLFRSAVPMIETLCYPRSWSLSILGLHYYLRAVPNDDAVRNVKIALADRLSDAFDVHEAEDWPWFENVVTYDNGRVPQALILAGHQLDRTDLVDRGLRTLRWLLEIQTAPQGHLSIIGNDGWLVRGEPRAAFDQQPLEAAALIAACKAAFRASGDRYWLDEMRRCFEWYLGKNDVGISMVDFKTRGCFDGLKRAGVNHNQGAESLLSWLLSLAIMHEMQTGDAPKASKTTLDSLRPEFSTTKPIG